MVPAWLGLMIALFLACKGPPSCCVLLGKKERERDVVSDVSKSDNPVIKSPTLMTYLNLNLITFQRPHLQIHLMGSQCFYRWIGWVGETTEKSP